LEAEKGLVVLMGEGMREGGRAVRRWPASIAFGIACFSFWHCIALYCIAQPSPAQSSRIRKDKMRFDDGMQTMFHARTLTFLNQCWQESVRGSTVLMVE
jgi:hypothetical protein